MPNLQQAQACRDVVARVVQASECVPFIGGHAVLLPDLHVAFPDGERPICQRHRLAPGHAARAYLLLALLGKAQADRSDVAYFGESAEKFFNANWLGYTWAWFEQRIVELSRIAEHQPTAQALRELAPRRRGEVMLGALLDAAKQSPRLTAGQCRELEYVWFDRAEQRLAAFVKKRRGKIRLPPLTAPPARDLTAADPRWVLASEILRRPGDRTAALQVMYGLHVFHAAIDVRGVAHDDPRAASNKHQARRTHFYSALLDLLRHGCRADGLRPRAEHMARVMQRMPLFAATFNGDGARKAPPPTLPAPDRLPDCFNTYERTGPVRLADTLSQARGPAAKARIVEAHHLGELLADQLIDPLRARGNAPECGHGFTRADYTYIHNRARFSRARGASRDVPDGDHFLRRMTAYFQHMARGRISEIVVQHLPDVHSACEGACGAAGADCAMCHIHSPR